MNALLEVNISRFVREYIRHKPKEKMETILEPMQVMVQLGLLGFCPIGTKISVSENVLHLQLPTISQGVLRWFNKDSKEDLYFLFNVVRRYYQWYNGDKVYKYIAKLAKRGLEKLIKTYEKCEMPSITHTLSMYKMLMDTDMKFPEDGMDKVFQGIMVLYNEKLMKVIYNTFRMMEMEEEEKYKERYYMGLQKILGPMHEKIYLWIQDNLSC